MWSLLKILLTLLAISWTRLWCWTNGEPCFRQSFIVDVKNCSIETKLVDRYLGDERYRDGDLFFVRGYVPMCEFHVDQRSFSRT